MALLEMTKRRRKGAAGALAGLPLRWLGRDALFGVVTLRFNINYLTGINRLSSEKILSERELWLLTTHPRSFS
jgi:hypothetical protein